MAEFGAKLPCFQPEGRATGVVLGKLVTANLAVTLASGEIYADDAVAESLSEFAEGALAMETDDMTDAVAGTVYGATVTGGEVVYNKDDTPPEGKLAYYKILLRRGARRYKTCFYPRVKAALGNDDATTRGKSITFHTAKTSFTVMTDENGDWRRTKEFETEAEAATYVKSLCGITT